jgi:hypothetical protein
LQENLALKQKINGYQVPDYSSISLVHPTLYLIKLGLSDFWKAEETEEPKAHNPAKLRSMGQYKRFLSYIVKIAKTFFN